MKKFLTFPDFSGIIFVLRVRETKEETKKIMKTFRIETEDRYGRFNDYDIQAESLEVATAIAARQPHVIVMDVKEV